MPKLTDQLNPIYIYMLGMTQLILVSCPTLLLILLSTSYFIQTIQKRKKNQKTKNFVLLVITCSIPHMPPTQPGTGHLF